MQAKTHAWSEYQGTQVPLAERMEVSTGTIGTIESKRNVKVKEVYVLALEGLAALEERDAPSTA